MPAFIARLKSYLIKIFNSGKDLSLELVKMSKKYQ